MLTYNGVRDIDDDEDQPSTSSQTPETYQEQIATVVETRVTTSTQNTVAQPQSSNKHHYLWWGLGALVLILALRKPRHESQVSQTT